MIHPITREVGGLKSIIVLMILCGLLLTGCSIKGSKPMPSDAYDALQPEIDNLTVRSLEDQAVALEDLWQDRRVVLVFLRHYG